MNEETTGLEITWDFADQFLDPIWNSEKNQFHFRTQIVSEFKSIEVSKPIKNLQQSLSKKAPITTEKALNFILEHPSSPALAQLSQLCRKSGHGLVQASFFTPPIILQDISRNLWNMNEFLSYAYIQLNWMRDILKESGFLIVHAWEQNYARIRIILDLIFGRENHIATLIWKKREKNTLLHTNIPVPGLYGQTDFDYVLIYCKNLEKMTFYKLPPDPSSYANPDNDPRGPWNSMPLVASQKSSNEIFTYTFKNGTTITKKFRYAYDSIKQLEAEGRLHYTNPKGRAGIPRVKKFYYERLEEYNETGERGTTPNSLWTDVHIYGSLDELWRILQYDPKKMPFIPFRGEKLYLNLLEITTRKNDYIFDPYFLYGQVVKAAESADRRWIAINFPSIKSYHQIQDYFVGSQIQRIT